MKTLIPAAIRCSLMLTAVTASLFSVQPAQAYTITLEQMGVNVVATGSGALNLTGLTPLGLGFLGIPGLDASPPDITIDAGTPGPVSFYTGFTGPSSFGSGGFTPASSSSGKAV